MPSLQHELPVVQQGDNLLCDARTLHRLLLSKRQFGDWIKDKVVKSMFKEGIDYFSQKSEKLSVGRKGIDFFISIDTAKHLAMMENSEIGYAVRCKFIEKEKELRGQISLPAAPELFKGLKPSNINGRTLYPYKSILERCGYSTRSSSSQRRHRYPGHFVLNGKHLFITTEFALQLHQQRQVINNRIKLKAMQPVLPFNFGEPLTNKRVISSTNN